jgi:DNA-binding transcriptional LysR family regulator
VHASVLKYFVEVARCGSIRKAAQNLFVASSAINRQIRNLAAELGTELFDRLPSGMRLNAAGERVLQHVRGTLHDYHLTRTELDALKGERTGHVSLASMDSLFVDFLPAAVEDFAEAYPAVTYELTALSPGEVPAWVASGRCDIGISFLSRLPAGLKVMARAPFPLGVIMAPSHPLARKAAIGVADCEGQPFLRSSGPSPVNSAQVPEFGRFWDAVAPHITCNSTPLLKRLIVAGKGIAFFSKIAFMDELARGDLVWRPLNIAAVNAMEAGIFVARQRPLSHVTGAFVERLMRRFRQMAVAAAG